MKKLVNSAAERNKEPILQTLKKYIKAPQEGTTCLEISSGTGQHVVHFAREFPNIRFYPSEFDVSSLGSINAYIFESGLHNISSPTRIDVTEDLSSWTVKEMAKPNNIDYIININMIHITPFNCTKGLFLNSGILLRPAGLLFTYGPYASNGKIEPESNVRFNDMLKRDNPEWGLRDIERDLIPVAELHGLQLIDRENLPANNKVLIWKKVENTE